MTKNHFLGGVAQVDITPPLGTIINGDFVAHYATQIHDPLFAKALALQSNGQLLVIVMVDICIMPADFIDEVKSLACATQTTLTPEQILIASTHTHAAGSVSDVHLTGPDVQYRRKLPQLITKAILEAIQAMHPAEIAFGSVDVPEHVLCRRYQMQGEYKAINPVTGLLDAVKTNPFGGEDQIIQAVAPVDPEVSYLTLRSLESGAYFALVANYSLHYVGDWENGTLSADYFGYFAQRVKERLQTTEELVAMMSNGTSGDVNIWDFAGVKGYPTGLFEKSELIGADIADRVVQSMDQLQWHQPVLKIHYDTLSIQVDKPDTLAIERATSIVKSSTYETLQSNAEGLKALYAREQLLLNEFPDEVVLPLQVFKIGDCIVGALPGEFFSETGLFLKQNALQKYFTITMANGNFGYIPPRHEKERGGYETWRCRYSCLQADAEEVIREKLLTMINA